MQMPSKITINTTIILRVPTASDAPELFTVINHNRAYLSHYLTWLPQVSSLANEMDTLKRAQPISNRQARYVICASGRIIGSIDLRPTIAANTGEIGYWLAEDAQGHGYMTQAVHALIVAAFANSSYSQLMIHAAVTNRGSNAIAKRTGFSLQQRIPNLEHLTTGTEDSNEWLLKKYTR